MTNDFLLALQITALGMGLVFAAIILLWWMMNLLTFLTADKVPRADILLEGAPAGSALAVDHDLKAQVAAVAVAVALAEQQASLAHPLIDPPTAIVSAWQLGTRTRQLYEKRTPIVRMPRKIG
ncbi:MAG TPA: OadG family protein [Anaerolineales bacterium]|nr:OadG family protein [Anaerolineales bacterium]HLO34388.1 OadG family protein [Anaerolineales bacterium]